ncbi:Alpha/Beta hydrolase protein [Xylogone sp. PMI_703]|nr:Alpha/Beta hydrolase protein [Xylogone sp. PMI_703]
MENSTLLNQIGRLSEAIQVPFEKFDIEAIIYKRIHDQDILLDVMVPKNIPAGTRPVSLRFHGGYLVNGGRNSPAMTPPRIINHAASQGLILVTSDYRLLPESSGKDILEDINDVWTWTQSELNRLVQKMTWGRVEANMNRIMLSGESAGGYLAIQLALSHAKEVCAVIATYPMIDLRDPFYTSDYPKLIAGSPQYDNELVDRHLKTLPDGPCPTMRDIEQKELAYAMLQRGRYVEFLGKERVLFPLERLEDNPCLVETLPYIWLHHGTADTEVPIEGSRKFVTKLKSLNPSVRIRYTELEGADHGLPSEISLLASGEWVEGIKTINELLFAS